MHANVVNTLIYPLHRNTDCDYSAAYVTLFTDTADLVGYGMSFTTGRGNDIVSIVASCLTYLLTAC